ncbi:hypothetical protein [Bradyrhizobium sp.]|uniref:hypothetical protein n=1 Tax=Bradyrhizobium sp. TaxID=376 RepID=UPI002CD44424|nr:hypothetical protein [Bradyrhizobium sp.]HWX63315.1 hypothetical protein [Bradyrhizobium sp.]
MDEQASSAHSNDNRMPRMDVSYSRFVSGESPNGILQVVADLDAAAAVRHGGAAATVIAEARKPRRDHDRVMLVLSFQ